MKASDNSVASWGVVLQCECCGEMTTATHSGIIKGIEATNQTAELKAAVEGLWLTRVGSNVTLYVDSAYVHKGITEWIDGWKKRGWKNANKKPVKQRELWQELDALCNERNVTIKKVAGHSGHDLNEAADTVCNDALDRYYGQLTDSPHR